VKWWASFSPAGQNVNVLRSHVAEILLAEAAFRLRIRCLRFWQRDRDASLFACAVVV
jgi:hypothetical protein